MARLTKVTGAGNHFLVADLRGDHDRRSLVKALGSLDTKKKRSGVARRLCDPYQSLGADGVLFLERSRFADVRWDFYNADGSSAEMCGNAARCVGRYLADTKSSSKKFLTKKKSFSIETKAGIVNAIVDKSVVNVEMPEIRAFQQRLPVKIDGREVYFDFVNSGVPHAVVHFILKGGLPALMANKEELQEITDTIRALDLFRRSSTNVTFVVQKNSSSIDSLTFERGVAGFTQACGTGAVAAAVSFACGKPRHITVNVPGGQLKVDLRGKRPVLSGPAKIVATVELKG